MNKQPSKSTIGFLQATGVALYITMFVSFVNFVESRSLFMSGEKKQAFLIVVWSAVWLLAILGIFLTALLLRI